MNNNISSIEIKEYQHENKKEIQYRFEMDYSKLYETKDIINFFVHLFNYYVFNKVSGTYSISTMYADNYKPIEIFFTEFDNTKYMQNAVFSADKIKLEPFKYLFVNIVIDEKNKMKEYYKLLADCFGMTTANKLIIK